MTLSRFALAISLVLVGCDDPVDLACEDEAPNGALAFLVATIDGHSFESDVCSSRPRPTFSLEGPMLMLSGMQLTGITHEDIAIYIPAYRGPGSYPIGPAGESTVAGAFYYSETWGLGQARSNGTPGDSIWIDSVESNSMVLVGRFRFHAVSVVDSSLHLVDSGEFRLLIHPAH